MEMLALGALFVERRIRLISRLMPFAERRILHGPDLSIDHFEGVPCVLHTPTCKQGWLSARACARMHACAHDFAQGRAQRMICTVQASVSVPLPTPDEDSDILSSRP